MDRCPICDVAVRPENLVRHLNDIHPRHPDTPGLLEKLKVEPGRAARRPSGRPIRIHRWQVLLIVVIVVVAVGAYYAVQVLTPSHPFPCISTEGGTAYHWHTLLSISEGSTPVTIPAGIGQFPLCLEPLHTHDASGRIHIESDDVNHRYTIGDFFLVWNRPWGNPTVMHVNGNATTPDQAQVLLDGESIHIQY